ncbi:MAG: molybdopterin-dependent oxidoreductase [Myxococcota bacterium]
MSVHHRTCHFCEAMCGLRLTVESGRVVRTEGDEADPLSRGHVCPKAFALAEFHEDPDRLRKPLRRRGRDFEEINWSTALDEAAERMHELQTRHGRHALGMYVGNPAAHSFPALMSAPNLLRGLRSKHRFSATSVDQLPHMLAAHAMLGHQLFLPVPDVDRTEFMVVIGANPLVSNGSIMSAPDIRRRLQDVRERGELIVIDPRRTATAKAATRHHFITPGSDAYLLASMVREVIARGERLGRLAPFVDGIDDLKQWVEPFTLELAAARTGIEGDAIVALVEGLLTHERAVVYGRLGTCVQEFGGLCGMLLVALNVLSGHLDAPGGLMFATPAVPMLQVTGPGGFGRFHSGVRGLPEFGGELPVSTLAEEIRAGNIAGMITLAGNPVLSTPSGHRLDEALASLEFMVSIDPYMNETTRHAHIILPPASPLERPHYDLVFHALAVRNTANYSPPIFDTDQPHDGQISLGLVRRLLRLRHGPANRRYLQTLALEQVPLERLLDAALRIGPYGRGIAGIKTDRKGRPQPKGKLSLKYLKEHPSGVDLGPLTPAYPDRAPTGRIQLAPAFYEADFERLRDHAPSKGLRLIGRRQLRSNNSWMHNAPSLMKGRDRCTLHVHPKDGARLGLTHGARCEVQSASGRVELAVELTDDVMEGVVSLPHGFGHSLEGVRLETATEKPGVSANVLTDAAQVDALTGNAILNGVPVSVRPLAHG